jgi:hypothetical protein
VVGDHDAVVPHVAQHAEGAEHVEVALVHEDFLVVRHLPAHVAEVDVGDLPLATVVLDALVHVAVAHLLEGAEAELEGIGRAGREIQDLLVLVRLVHQTRGSTQEVGGRVVRVQGELHPALLGDRDDLREEPLVALPELVRRDGGNGAGGGVPVVDHVPDHPVGDRGPDVDRRLVIHLRDRLPSAEGALRPSPHARHAEVVAHDRDPGASDVLDGALEVLHLLDLPRPVEQDVVPVRGVEVLDRLPLQAVRLDVLPDVDQILVAPELSVSLGVSPSHVGFAGGDVRVLATEVVDQMHDQVRDPGLLREAKIVLAQEAAVESKSEIHNARIRVQSSKYEIRQTPLNALNPPSIGITVPVTKDAASLQSH